ncbi:sugar ABC transporter permease [Agrobacterium sp. SHOUNA12C]|uniref:Sugar ABC transporter n=2 Tax=Rhizobium rhizogenes TaxID=359 RepID=B9JJT2_RHIR8|nr:sugar ABC transporter permease [Rhizobium rhizogenes]ACM30174.1 sugar ABC transporter [Rhizobium rhizogenes K84]KAA6488378.1 sugar ABC transporter permease [Agrobacterium sp. ICMP 7243]MCJ9719500.1 sugar ABC transporter permease [Agrobacterium sp. BETTINA12B]MCJ9755650.1 sugar ABC transporter permease [Agrobacterium sp. SHOUNA12C]OCJ02011.1 sugar ABC transporter permease [Agrobacterium sp. 13-626]OCJ10619.1 sugar ABC transporter permease [Agrobacterium sp. B131/95]
MMTFWRYHRWWLTPALLILPAAILFSVVILWSAVESVWISLHEWDGFSPMVWIGLGNYVELFNDPQFYVSLKNNVIWLVMFMAAPPLGLAIALLVNQKIRGMRLMKSLFFIPLVLASVAVGVVFTWVYTPQLGLLALIFGFFGATAPALLSNEHLVTFAIVIAALWPQIAFCMVLYLAGLNNLSEELIGAGRVDGARGWNMLRHIVLPQLTQVTFIAIAVTVVGALRSFDMVSVMTQGGPFGSSEVLAYQMFEQSIFSYRFGYGAAIASVLFVIMAVFIVWYLTRIIRIEERGA